MDTALVDILFKIIIVIATLSLGGFSKVFWDNFKEMKTRMDNIETVINNDRSNSFERLAEVNNNINNIALEVQRSNSETKLEIITAIKDLEIKFMQGCDTRHQILQKQLEKEFKLNKEQ
jgi:hypothetical protein